MKKNVNTIDRIVRVAAGAILIGTGFTGVIPGAWGIAAGLVGLVLVGTAAVSFCPIYAALGVSTRARD